MASSIDSGAEIVLLRPEIPIRICGPAGEADVLAPVDTGADNSIFPLSIATDLGIVTTPGRGPGAIAFGGQQIALSFAEVAIELTRDLNAHTIGSETSRSSTRQAAKASA